MTPRALLFDLDDTLMPEWPAIHAGYAAVAERVWGESTEARVRELTASARAIWDTRVPTAYRRRVHLSLGEGLYGDLAGRGPDAEALRAAVEQLHARAFDDAVPPQWRWRSPELLQTWRRGRIAALTVYPETVEILEHWAGRLPLGLVTNGASVLQRRKLAATGLQRFFAALVISEELGVGKPDPAMFRAALDALAVAPVDAVMVGNDPGRDVAGARAAGIRPVWVDRGDPAPEPPAERITDLRQLTPLLSI